MSVKTSQIVRIRPEPETEPPLARQGEALRKARGERSIREIVENVTDPDTGKMLSIGRYQHWERGVNAPRRALFAALSKQLGIDVAGLYTPGESQGEAIKVAALRPILAAMRRHLDLLDMLINAASADEKKGSATKKIETRKQLKRR